MTKHGIRLAMRSRLPLALDVRATKSARICDEVRRLPAWQAARCVMLFAPQDCEPDVDLLWPYAGSRRMVYPRVEEGILGIYSVESVRDLQPGRWGLREPAGLPENLVLPEEVDLILVPGVAFTAAGARCGRGGGFYDRLLEILPAEVLKVGVCFAEQMMEDVPTEPHDMRVDAVVSA